MGNVQPIFDALWGAIRSFWGLLGFATCLLIFNMILARLGLRNIDLLSSQTLRPSTRKNKLGALILWGALEENATDEVREQLLRQYLALSGYRMVGAALAGILFCSLVRGVRARVIWRDSDDVTSDVTSGVLA